MPHLIILKLGGSIITEKGRGRPGIERSRLRRIASEIRRAWINQPRLRLIILYGAGSFGHPLARRYRLHGSPLTTEQLRGIGRTVTSMRKLGTALATIFLKAGLPVIPLQTSAAVRQVHGRLKFATQTLLPIIRDILRHRGIPLLGGDVAFSDDGQSVIASADALAVVLARHLEDATIAFATNVDGVYQTFPPRRRDRALRRIRRPQLAELIESSSRKSTKYDVTGAMAGKLSSLLVLRRCRAVIFNGTKPAILRRVLRRKSAGTVIRF